jgi:NADPH-dependent glutamate synthase beta subunit-like oxidoreductase/Pyruvate/2-oxoacid:ferredoxin oxidoreductase delta subunit
MDSNAFQAVLRWPEQLEKLPPCQDACPSGNDIRGWIATITQSEAQGLGREDASTLAWSRLVSTNPFPATMGRICPAPCETRCNRNYKDGAVGIHALERYIGDWALRNGLALPRLDVNPQHESIGVIGAGPAGLSFACQMARRGYPVTIYEAAPEPGGMLRYGIPEYRLPKNIRDGEIQRILDLGVDLRLNTRIGREVMLAGLYTRHSGLFLGIGAQQGRSLRIPGEEGPGIWTGVDYLKRMNSGRKVAVGDRAVVIGGGNSAINAARIARRAGAAVFLLYRRSREEMPAIENEIDNALQEGVNIEYLAAPREILREGGRIRALVVQKMQLAEPDKSGRRRPVPVAGAEYELPVDSVIAAISQEPVWENLGDLRPRSVWMECDASGRADERLWAGGDVLGLGIASHAIAQGRQAAEAMHAQLRGLANLEKPRGLAITADQIRLDYYAEHAPVKPPARPPEEWLNEPDREICQTIEEDPFLQEITRCFSCGLCFGCQRCWMYCNPSSYTRLQETGPGAYFSLDLDSCEGCGKCIEICPCGFLSLRKTEQAATA